MCGHRRVEDQLMLHVLMANAKDLCCKGRPIRISYRRATLVVCAGNLVVMLCLMYLYLSPLFLRTSSSLSDLVTQNGISSSTNTKEGLDRLKSSYKLRRALLPTHLINEVKELQVETESDIRRTKLSSAARYKRSTEVLQRLAQVKQSSNTQSNQHGLLQKWKKKKLQTAKSFVGRHQGAANK